MLVLQIEPALSPCVNRIQLLQIKIGTFFLNVNACLPHGILRVRPLYVKEAFPEPPMGIDPQEALTMSDKADNVQNPIGRQIMQLQLVGIQQAPDERMNRKRKPTRKEALKAYPFIRLWRRNFFIPWNPSRALRHQTIVHQHAQIYNPEDGPLPSTSHPRRVLSRAGALG